MVFEAAQCRFIELGITNHTAVCRHERDAMREREPRRVGQGIRVDSTVPLCGYQPGLPQQLGGRRIAQPVAQTPIKTANGQDNKNPADE